MDILISTLVERKRKREHKGKGRGRGGEEDGDIVIHTRN